MSPLPVGAGNRVELTLGGVTNPAAGAYRFGVWTSSDPRLSFVPSSTDGTAADQTAVNAVGLSASNGTSTSSATSAGLGGLTYTASLALSASGGLPAQTWQHRSSNHAPASISTAATAPVTPCSARPRSWLPTSVIPPTGGALQRECIWIWALGTVLAISVGHAIPAGDAISVTVSGIDIALGGTTDLNTVTVWTSADTLPQQLTLPAGSGGFVYGLITAGSGPIPAGGDRDLSLVRPGLPVGHHAHSRHRWSLCRRGPGRVCGCDRLPQREPAEYP